VQLLRASAKHKGENYNLSAVTSGIGDGGVPHGELLMRFGEIVLGSEGARLVETRQALLDAVGPEGLVDAAGVAGLFNAIDRVADATGTPLEDWKASSTADFRAEIGVDAFARRRALLDEV
jgi:hypothetical protein